MVGLKLFWNSVSQNTFWMLGNGKRINFLCDNWIQQNIASTLNILESYQQHLQALVANFISKNRWNLPSWFVQKAPILATDIQNTAIPFVPTRDFPVWKPSDSRTLSFRQAFDFLYFANNAIPWAKMIWRPCIPLTKMLVLWRYIKYKLPTNYF